VIDPRGIEGRRPALHAVNDVSLGQKKLGEISAILAGHPGDQRDLARWSSHYVTARMDAALSIITIIRNAVKRPGAGSIMRWG